jgi:hypothetical protein
MPFVFFLVLLLTFPQLCRAGDTPYSAIVMSVKGKAVVQHKGKRVPADLGYLLYPGDEVTTAKNASLTINYLESGLEEQWPGGMKFVIEKIESSPAISRMKKTYQKIILPQMKYQQTGSIRLRGSGNAVAVNALSNTCIIEERPAFRWSPITAADHYKVTLYCEFKDEASWHRTTKVTEMPYPEDETSLNFGSRYEWEIEAIENGTVIAAKRSCFYLPRKDEIDTIREQLKRYRAQLSNNRADSTSQLTLIFFLEQHQLYDDAMEQYQALTKVSGKSESMRKREESLVHIRNSACTYSWPE